MMTSWGRTTSLVTHWINMGDSPPIKQTAAEAPFRLTSTCATIYREDVGERCRHPLVYPLASPVALVAK